MIHFAAYTAAENLNVSILIGPTTPKLPIPMGNFDPHQSAAQTVAVDINNHWLSGVFKTDAFVSEVATSWMSQHSVDYFSRGVELIRQ